MCVCVSVTGFAHNAFLNDIHTHLPFSLHFIHTNIFEEFHHYLKSNEVSLCVCLCIKSLSFLCKLETAGRRGNALKHTAANTILILHVIHVTVRKQVTVYKRGKKRYDNFPFMQAENI